MSLSSGSRIGPYEIVAPLGAGGMGEVYRATDTHLKRAVAIKVLPPSVAGDADRLARFQREAEVLAALNHPNIAHIHGLEKSSGVTALVMELVEGEDLSQIISRGPIPVADALPIAKQIAEALEVAHEQGIVHRDLKPANIKVRPDGTVKVLDFGLAKAFTPPAATSPEAMNSPTLTTPAMTHFGMILGTAAYMAPEQARGKLVDRRADIWAFGAVLFEMLTGRRAFAGDDATDTVVAVISKEPDWAALPPIPAPLRRLLARCLKKDPKARLRDIGEARVLIEELIAGAPDEHAAAPVIAAPVATPHSTRWRALTWVWAAATLGLAIAVVMLWAPWRHSSSGSAALQFTPLSFEQGGQTPAVWSPDGKAVVYGARSSAAAPYQLFVRYLDSPVATQITHDNVSHSPIAWTSAGRIIFSSTQPPLGLWSISPVGGEAVPLQTMDRAPSAAISPDGKAVAWLHTDNGMTSIWVSSPIGSEPKPYLPAPFASPGSVNTPSLDFSPDGKKILLCRNPGPSEDVWLMPYPADPKVPPRKIFQNVGVFGATPSFSWMPDSRHVVLGARIGAGRSQLYLGDTETETLVQLSSGTTNQRSPAVSPDGSKLVFLEEQVDFDVVSVDLATAAATPVIATQRNEQMPAWSQNEDTLVYVTDRNGGPEVWLRKVGQPDRPLVTTRDFPGETQFFMAPALSPDGTRVIYSHKAVDGRPLLWMSSVAGGSPVRVSTVEGATEYSGSWSPDGKWFAYWQIGSDGQNTLNKIRTTGTAAPEAVRTGINRTGTTWIPVWSPSGDSILYPDRGTKLASPDGKTVRELSPVNSAAFAFARDGKTLYGLRPENRRIVLFSVRIADGAESTIGSLDPEYLPATSYAPAVRMTLAPDGKSATFSVGKRDVNLWLLDGLKSMAAR